MKYTQENGLAARINSKNLRSRKLKILLISSIPPPIGGISIWTDQFIKYPWMENNLRLLSISSIVQKGGNTRFRFKRNAMALIYSIWGLVRIIYRIIFDRPDIFHICCSKGMSFYRSIFYAFVIKLFAKKTVIHFHSNLNTFCKNKRIIFYHIFKNLHYIVDAFVSINVFDRETLNEMKFQGSIYKINNFVNNVFFVRRKINKNNQIFRLPYIGWIIPEKGLNELILSIRYLSNVKLQLIGPIIDKTYFHYLMRQIECLGLSERVQYHGSISQLDLIEKYLNSDAFVLPSHSESFSLVLAEAMALGLPVICTKVGLACELKQGENALIIPQKDSIALKDAIVLLMNDLTMRLRMSECNHAYAMQNFRIDEIILQWLKVYRALAS